MSTTAKNGSGNTHILIIDDEEPIRDILQKSVQRAGYDCSVAATGEEGLKILEESDMDVVITDIQMPGIDGFEILNTVKEKYNSDVIVMTGFIEDYKYEQIIDKGANDFLHKPISPREIIVRLKRILRERSLLAERNQAHENLQSAHQDLHDAYFDTINRLSIAAEFKDTETGNHISRMSRYSALVAEKIGLPDKDVKNILYASPMHDVGKIGIPDSILLKPGKLTDEEFNIMKTHTTIGSKILSNSKAEVLQIASQIASTHHEKWNGKGYPGGLSGEDIPLYGRIIAVADVFDVLTSPRPYKDPYPVQVALSILREEQGEHLDPMLLDIFIDNIDEILRIKDEIGLSPDASPDNFILSERDQLSGMKVSQNKS